MNLPNLKEAKVRTKKEVRIIRDDYKLSDSMKVVGKDKKYLISRKPYDFYYIGKERINKSIEGLQKIK